MERAGGKRGRDRAGAAPRLQGRNRFPQRTRLRLASNQRAGAGNQDRSYRPDKLWRSARRIPPASRNSLRCSCNRSAPRSLPAMTSPVGAAESTRRAGRGDRRAGVVRGVASPCAVSDQPSELSLNRCRATPRRSVKSRRFRSHSAAGRSVLRGHLVCGRGAIPRRRRRRADRGIARAAGVQHRLDAGIVGDMAASMAALADIVGARQSSESKLAAQRRNQALAELSARESEATRRGWKKPGTASQTRWRG